MNGNQLRDIIDRFVNGSPKSYYYAKPGTTLVRDLYAEHHGYDVMAMVRDDNFPMPKEHLVDDELDEVKCVTIPDFVDVQVKSDDNVVIKSLRTNDPFLNKLMGNGNFIGTLDEQDPPLEGTYAEESDPEKDIVDVKYKMWYMRNGFRCLLVYYGRDIALGRCASKRKLKGVHLTSTGPSDNEKTPTKGKGKGVADNEKTHTNGKGKGIADESQPEYANTHTKWTKERIKRVKDTPTSYYCSFRLWASWMSLEKSFQIKSLYPDHKCVRNYNMGSLVKYRRIASHYTKEIINNLFITVRYMQNDIREKFMVDVSLGQCKRAKQYAIYDQEGGLVKHYSKLWEYREAVLESNPGSTCHLDVEYDKGIAYFKRFYGELLTAMGQDANNQMFPVAWAIVGVENINNWAWFLEGKPRTCQSRYSNKDSDLVPVDEEPVKKGKRLKTPAKKFASKPARGIVISEPPVETMSKRKEKEKVDVTHGKGIELLSDVALTEEAMLKEVRKKSLRDFHRTHPSGSGTVVKKPPRIATITPTVTSEGIGEKLGVPDVTKEDSIESESESWGNDEDGNNNKQDSSNEGSEQENESEEQESDSEQDEESKDDDQEEEEFDQENESEDDEMKIDEEQGMDDTTDQFNDDANARLEEPTETAT
ncbi:hypothetical protein Tco_1229604 [Tanacetum coccineum]